jgi:hypothetical protein
VGKTAGDVVVDGRTDVAVFIVATPENTLEAIGALLKAGTTLVCTSVPVAVAGRTAGVPVPVPVIAPVPVLTTGPGAREAWREEGSMDREILCVGEGGDG